MNFIILTSFLILGLLSDLANSLPSYRSLNATNQTTSPLAHCITQVPQQCLVYSEFRNCSSTGTVTVFDHTCATLGTRTDIPVNNYTTWQSGLSHPMTLLYLTSGALRFEYYDGGWTTDLEKDCQVIDEVPGSGDGGIEACRKKFWCF